MAFTPDEFQADVLCRWVNASVRGKNPSLPPLTSLGGLGQTDMIIHLVNVMVNPQFQIKHFNANPTLPRQLEENANLAIRALNSSGFMADGISARQVADGDVRALTMFLPPLAVRSVAPGAICGRPGQSGLQAWCKDVLTPQKIAVKEFGRMWADGRCLAGLANVVAQTAGQKAVFDVTAEAAKQNALAVGSPDRKDAEADLVERANAVLERFGVPALLHPDIARIGSVNTRAVCIAAGVIYQWTQDKTMFKGYFEKYVAPEPASPRGGSPSPRPQLSPRQPATQPAATQATPALRPSTSATTKPATPAPAPTTPAPGITSLKVPLTPATPFAFEERPRMRRPTFSSNADRGMTTPLPKPAPAPVTPRPPVPPKPPVTPATPATKPAAETQVATPSKPPPATPTAAPAPTTPAPTTPAPTTPSAPAPEHASAARQKRLEILVNVAHVRDAALASWLSTWERRVWTFAARPSSEDDCLTAIQTCQDFCTRPVGPASQFKTSALTTVPTSKVGLADIVQLCSDLQSIVEAGVAISSISPRAPQEHAYFSDLVQTVTTNNQRIKDVCENCATAVRQHTAALAVIRAAKQATEVLTETLRLTETWSTSMTPTSAHLTADTDTLQLQMEQYYEIINHMRSQLISAVDNRLCDDMCEQAYQIVKNIGIRIDRWSKMALAAEGRADLSPTSDRYEVAADAALGRAVAAIGVFRERVSVSLARINEFTSFTKSLATVVIGTRVSVARRVVANANKWMQSCNQQCTGALTAALHAGLQLKQEIGRELGASTTPALTAARTALDHDLDQLRKSVEHLQTTLASVGETLQTRLTKVERDAAQVSAEGAKYIKLVTAAAEVRSAVAVVVEAEPERALREALIQKERIATLQNEVRSMMKSHNDNATRLLSAEIDVTALAISALEEAATAAATAARHATSQTAHRQASDTRLVFAMLTEVLEEAVVPVIVTERSQVTRLEELYTSLEERLQTEIEPALRQVLAGADAGAPHEANDDAHSHISDFTTLSHKVLEARLRAATAALNELYSALRAARLDLENCERLTTRTNARLAEIRHHATIAAAVIADAAATAAAAATPDPCATATGVAALAVRQTEQLISTLDGALPENTKPPITDAPARPLALVGGPVLQLEAALIAAASDPAAAALNEYGTAAARCCCLGVNADLTEIEASVYSGTTGSTTLAAEALRRQATQMQSQLDEVLVTSARAWIGRMGYNVPVPLLKLISRLFTSNVAAAIRQKSGATTTTGTSTPVSAKMARKPVFMVANEMYDLLDHLNLTIPKDTLVPLLAPFGGVSFAALALFFCTFITSEPLLDRISEQLAAYADRTHYLTAQGKAALSLPAEDFEFVGRIWEKHNDNVRVDRFKCE